VPSCCLRQYCQLLLSLFQPSPYLVDTVHVQVLLNPRDFSLFLWLFGFLLELWNIYLLDLATCLFGLQQLLWKNLMNTILLPPRLLSTSSVRIHLSPYLSSNVHVRVLLNPRGFSLFLCFFFGFCWSYGTSICWTCLLVFLGSQQLLWKNLMVKIVYLRLFMLNFGFLAKVFMITWKNSSEISSSVEQ